jgi:hypothetical protein
VQINDEGEMTYPKIQFMRRDEKTHGTCGIMVNIIYPVANIIMPCLVTVRTIILPALQVVLGRKVKAKRWRSRWRGAPIPLSFVDSPPDAIFFVPARSILKNGLWTCSTGWGVSPRANVWWMWFHIAELKNYVAGGMVGNIIAFYWCGFLHCEQHIMS